MGEIKLMSKATIAPPYFKKNVIVEFGHLVYTVVRMFFFQALLFLNPRRFCRF